MLSAPCPARATRPFPRPVIIRPRIRVSGPAGLPAPRLCGVPPIPRPRPRRARQVRPTVAPRTPHTLRRAAGAVRGTSRAKRRIRGPAHARVRRLLRVARIYPVSPSHTIRVSPSQTIRVCPVPAVPGQSAIRAGPVPARMSPAARPVCRLAGPAPSHPRVTERQVPPALSLSAVRRLRPPIASASRPGPRPVSTSPPQTPSCASLLNHVTRPSWPAVILPAIRRRRPIPAPAHTRHASSPFPASAPRRPRPVPASAAAARPVRSPRPRPGQPRSRHVPPRIPCPTTCPTTRILARPMPHDPARTIRRPRRLAARRPPLAPGALRCPAGPRRARRGRGGRRGGVRGGRAAGGEGKSGLHEAGGGGEGEEAPDEVVCRHQQRDEQAEHLPVHDSDRAKGVQVSSESVEDSDRVVPSPPHVFF